MVMMKLNASKTRILDDEDPSISNTNTRELQFNGIQSELCGSKILMRSLIESFLLKSQIKRFWKKVENFADIFINLKLFSWNFPFLFSFILLKSFEQNSP